MGDRRNVIVQHDKDNSVALYTHWSGSELPQTLARALDRGRGRWNDGTYLTRIVFSEMVKDEILGETGFGIEPIRTGATNYCEASPGYDLILDLPSQRVVHDDTTYDFETFVSAFKGE